MTPTFITAIGRVVEVHPRDYESRAPARLLLGIEEERFNYDRDEPETIPWAIPAVAYGQGPETALASLRRGDLVMLTGSLRLRSRSGRDRSLDYGARLQLTISSATVLAPAPETSAAGAATERP